MFLSAVIGLSLTSSVALCQVPDESRQLLLAVAPDWNSQHATLQGFQRDGENEPWRAVFRTDWPVLLGRNGLAWGRGVFSPPDDKQPRKTEKDGRAPAGIFSLGPLHGYATAAPQGTRWSYIQVGPYDAWIDDPRLPHYNEHVRVNPRQIPDWFESQKMRLGDNAYKWLLEIRHNTDPARPGSGSAIFFHVRRGPDRPTAGCTSMALEDLERVIVWLRPEARPHYVLLPREVYEKLRIEWKLP
ncbi:MAG: L,D-transpeptidase family protein [Verrucomicrobia bacterium]|nr:L,D-transpeptidase family protein [Verrucomicrobiota bacterium]